ncbi:MAG: hypothetical protein ACYSVY_07975 [Planctomycetota bacterium]
MPTPDTLALALIACTLLYYCAIGLRNYQQITTLDEYLIYGRHLGSRHFSETFVATGLSLASVLFFFFDLGPRSGFSLLWSPVAYVLSIVFLLSILRRFASHPRSAAFVTQGNSIISFLHECYRSSLLKWLAIVVSMLSLLGILTIEIYIGTKIFGVFGVLAGPDDRFFLLLVFTGLIYIYTYMGGFQSVVDTDRVQLGLMFTAFAVLIGFIVGGVVSAERPLEFPLALLSPDPTRFEPVYPGLLPGLCFCVSLFAMNFAMQISYLGNWQRIIAVGNMKELEGGFRRVAVITLAVWIVLIIGATATRALGGGIGASPGEGGHVLTQILERVKSSDVAIHRVVFFPVIMVGLTAALISTADSHMMPMIQTYMYDVRHIRPHILHGVAGGESVQMARRAVVVLLALAVVLYFVLVYKTKMEFVQLLLLFFTQQTCLFAPILYALVTARPSRVAAIASILVGIAVTWTFSLSGGLLAVNAPLGVLILGLLLMEGGRRVGRRGR